MSNLKISDSVTSKTYPEYKVGTILKINNIGDENYCEVFFSFIKEIKTLPEESLTKYTSSIEKMEGKNYDNPLLFSIRLLCEKILSLSHQDKIISANNFNILPLPHQILTINRVLDEFEPRFLIADEVGLGKTIEAALVFEELKLRKMVNRVLIICPSGLTSQWKDELKTKFNEDFVLINGDVFKGLSQIHEGANIWKKYNSVITSIDFIKPKLIKDSLSEKTLEKREKHNREVCENIVDAKWDLLIIDEAHNLTKDLDTHETARYKIGKDLSSNIPNVLLLTATPHQGKSERFRYLLELLDPYKFFDEGSLSSENVKSVTIKNKKRAAKDLDGNLLFKDRIVNLVKIPREKDNIETQLYNKVSDYIAYYHLIAMNSPILIFILITYQKMLSSSSRAIYHSLEKRYNLLKNNAKAFDSLNDLDFDDIRDSQTQETYDNLIKYIGEETEISTINFEQLKPHVAKEMAMLEECLNLAKKATTGRNDVKIEKLLEIIDEVLSREGLESKFIIFTEFIKTQEYIGEVLEEFGYKVTYINGQMSLDDKIANKTKFKEDHQFLISTDAGGEGINLQFAHVMINYDLPWNPMKIEQRIGRIDRIGQTKDVLVFNFIIGDTIEEHIRDVLDTKLDVIKDQFGEDKKRDVLTLLNEEYNFDKIYIEAVKARKIDEEKLNNIGDSMINKAKDIIESQQILIPFTDKKEENIKEYIVEDERILIEKLVKAYLDYKNIPLIEYSKTKNVYHIDEPINFIKYKNIVFDKKLALENEKYSYLNLSHPLVEYILDEITEIDSLSFDINITNYNEDIKGTLFLYSLEITNNEDFIRKELIPVFIDKNNNYNENLSNWFKDNNEFKIKMDFREDISESIEIIKTEAEIIKNQKVKEHMTNSKVEIYEKIEKETEKYYKYFKNKENEINKRGIENIKTSLLKKLHKHQETIELERTRRKTLVPQVNLFAIGEITLNKE